MNEQINKKTSNKMTIFEKAKIIGIRAEQLSENAPAFIDTAGMFDCIEIARKELEQKKLPFIIRRTLPDGEYEDWKINDLLVPDVDYF